MRTLALALLGVCGCIVGETSVVSAVGFIDAPRHGDHLPDNARLAFHGFVSLQDTQVEAQVKVDGRWETVAIAQVGPLPVDDRTPAMLEWSATADVAPILRAHPAGLLRIRVVAGDTPLAVLASDDRCAEAEAGNGHAAVATACAYAVADGAVLVGEASDDDVGRPRYLDRKGTAPDTRAYYAATGAAASLAEFRSRYGFGTPAEVSAVYYNRGDLAVGREMHCTEVPSTAGTGLACYSSNYGQFSGPVAPALDAAIAGFESGTSTGAFATVGMVYKPPIDAPDAVSFVVFDARGARVDTAQLDRYGDNISIPNNCMNCHGSASRFDVATASVRGARFLPFDPTMLAFSARAPYTEPHQRENLRELNAMIDRAAPTPGVKTFIDAIYPDGVDTPNGRLVADGIPAGWSGSREDRTVYQRVVAPFCRGCHQTNTGDHAFASAEAFRARAGEIASHICGSRTETAMPNAEVIDRDFWRSNARAYLVDYLGITTDCAR